MTTTAAATRHCAQYVTKDQALKLLLAWDCDEPLPKNGYKLVINFPNNGTNIYRIGVVNWSDKKSTYGKRLYHILLTNNLEEV